jgi:LysR family glycine cleavage system transcriptional activator
VYPPIQNLRAFVAVVEAGQFRSAAEKIGVSESAVSHQISRLEAQLGVQLLKRGRQGAELTDTGRTLFHRVSSGLREIELGVEEIKRNSVNAVTITAPRTFASFWLAPRLTSFYDEHPSVELKILATDRVCDLQAERIDLAIRRSSEQEATEERDLLCAEDIFPIGTEALRARIEVEGWETTLRSVPLILNEAHPDEWQLWSAAADQPLPKETKFRRLGSYDQVQAAVLAGTGIGMGRTPLSGEALMERRLHRIGQRSTRTGSYFIVWRPHQKMAASQLALLDWLRKTRDASLHEFSDQRA